MSRWTHVTGTIRVDTLSQIKREDFQKWLESRAALLPKITGSERDADIWIKEKPSYNLSTWENDTKIEYQTNAVITIDGDLRDRDEEQVIKELNELFKTITRNLHWMIDQYTILIDDEFIDNFKHFEYNIEE